MPGFMDLRASMPPAFAGSAGAALAASAQALVSALRQYQKAADLSSAWGGTASREHTQRLEKIVDAATRVIQAITQATTVTNSAGAQLTALKTQNDTIVASAMAGRFQVFPTGQVVPGPPHYAQASGPHGAALMKLFWSIANLYTGQVNGTVAASTATDAQVAATIAAMAMQFFSDLLKDKSDSSQATVGLQPTPYDPPISRPPAPGDPDFPDPKPIDETQGGGTVLAGAGAGALGGAGSLGLGPGGIGGIGGGPGGITGAGGAGAGGVLAGPGMIGPGGAMGAGAAGAGAGAAGRAAGGMMPMMPMMPMGAHGGTSSDHGRGADTWLQEDRDPFDPDDTAPGSVLS